MKNLLVSGLWMLLILSTANALWCHHCVMTGKARKCPSNEEFCWAEDYGACYTKELYRGRKLLSSEVGCFHECLDHTEPEGNIWTKFFCCFKDYCNEY